MKEQIRLNTLKKIENKISEEIEKPSYRDCLISALCTKKFTVETARMINERGILLCDYNDMNYSLCLKNGINIQTFRQFNDDGNLRYVLKCVDEEEPLTIINNEIYMFMKESKKLVKEIQNLVEKQSTFNSSETILSIFDNETQKRVLELQKKSFEYFKFVFSVELIFANKEGKEFIHEVEYAPREFERNIGLSCRPYLPDAAGMFYEFPQEGIHYFITTNVIRDLSVAYIKADGTITEIIDREADDRKSYANKVPSQFVLEMTKGWFENNNIHEGDKIKMKTIIANEWS